MREVVEMVLMQVFTVFMAIIAIGADFEHYRLVEFDKYAVKSYNAIHGTNFETSDVRNIHAIDLGIERRNEFTYLLTHFHARICRLQEKCRV